MTRILIAEDEPRIATFVESGLRAHGFSPTTVADGRSALDLAASGDFDLLLLDIGLPVLDGFTVLQRLREGHHRIPVIILTARSSVADTVSGLDAGADDYLAKPFISRSCWHGSGCGCARRARPRSPRSRTAGSASTCGPAARMSRGGRSSCRRASSCSQRPSFAIRARCCPVSSC